MLGVDSWGQGSLDLSESSLLGRHLTSIKGLVHVTGIDHAGFPVLSKFDTLVAIRSQVYLLCLSELLCLCKELSFSLFFDLELVSKFGFQTGFSRLVSLLKLLHSSLSWFNFLLYRLWLPSHPCHEVLSGEHSSWFLRLDGLLDYVLSLLSLDYVLRHDTSRCGWP